MFFLKRPTTEQVERLLAAAPDKALSYPQTGSTRGMATSSPAPRGYNCDHYRARLGSGEVVFDAARKSLAELQMIRLKWIEPCGPNPLDGRLIAAAEGATLATLARVAGLWWLNICRIVYAFDEDGATPRFGFAQATLSGHVERGEERFMVEWNRADDSVNYDLLVHSRPASLLAWSGYPFVRRIQRRFGRDSLAAMVFAAGVLPAPFIQT